MPARRRPRVSPTPTASSPAAASSTSEVDDALARFAAAVKDDEARKQREADARAAERRRAEDLEMARSELDRAIAAVRRAKESGRGRAEADAAWKVAKARVIELEQGAPPAWASSITAPVEAGDADAVDADDDDAVDGDDTVDPVG